ncbi:hypothetical protein [Maridesulfovibrio hydrothermalis]|uniref:Uncharacterized protein n=1 Tax=Maridesulfovibrio hydrothermalis AM13 = DSM 14728 TaxID=1121451 RepID=L0RF37_9BACT|nr:hypothetical protein [Maridesulfovibrio hydrothermalis]CCO24822.1 conserved protein of unknown function [Maridesulfovibrio hydrothermalis AM13 = DSM 14728]
MHKRLSDVYLNPEINEKIDVACLNLGVSKSMFLNVLLQELFNKAGPEDLFYNRVKLCDTESKIKAAIKKVEKIAH